MPPELCHPPQPDSERPVTPWPHLAARCRQARRHPCLRRGRLFPGPRHRRASRPRTGCRGPIHSVVN